MQCLSGQNGKAIPYKLLVFGKSCSPEYLFPSVFLVIEERMLYIAEVYSYLMSSAGFEFALHERNISKILNNAVVGYCRFALASVGEDLHYLSVADIPSDVSAYASFRWIGNPPYQGYIFSVSGSFIELS